MVKTTHITAGSIVLAVILMAACSGSDGTKYPSSNDESISSIAVQAEVFPHKALWATPEKHGKFVRKNGVTNTSTCANACHGKNLEGGTGPSCKKCHENWPHDAGWRNKENHGWFVVENGESACATKCHGADLLGGLAEVSCVKCHSIYPHADNFATPEIHGELAKGDDKNNCKTCHSDDLKGGDSKISCFDCHDQLYPHDTNWGKKENHGFFVAEKGKSVCATKCHGEDLAGGLSKRSCEECHTVWPIKHKTTDWKDDSHGNSFLDLGKNACLGCHGEDWNGGSSGTSCVTCHASLPDHSNDDWDSSGHGNYALTLNGDLSECKKCHGGEKLEGSGEASSCYKCHKSYPIPHKETNWTTTFNGHGQSVMSGSLSKNDCKICHGNDLTGGVSGKTCYNVACHSKFPHSDDWNGSAHGKYLIELGDNIFTQSTLNCETLNCHSSEGVTTWNVPACSNDACHTSFPEMHEDTAAWNAGDGHGDYVLNDLGGDKTECKKCHGEDFTGGNSGKTCYNDACHKFYPHLDGWQGEHGSKVLTNDDKFSLTGFNNDCKPCHGEAAEPNTKRPSADSTTVPLGILLASDGEVPRCYNCHYAYPHLGFKDVYKTVYDFFVLNIPSWEGGHKYYINHNEDFKEYIISPDASKIPPENEIEIENLILSIPKGCVGETGCHKTRRGPKKTYFGYQFCKFYCHSGQ